MATAVAIVSIVAGAAVAIIVPFINARLERSRLGQQSRDARLEELRVLLDGAAQHLYDAVTVLLAIDDQWIKELPKRELPEETLRRLREDLMKQTEVIVSDGLRIFLRTPRDAKINRAHEEARNLVIIYEVQYRGFVEREIYAEQNVPYPPTSDLQLHAIPRFVEEVRRFVGVVEATPVEEGWESSG